MRLPRVSRGDPSLLGWPSWVKKGALRGGMGGGVAVFTPSLVLCLPCPSEGFSIKLRVNLTPRWEVEHKWRLHELFIVGSTRVQYALNRSHVSRSARFLDGTVLAQYGLSDRVRPRASLGHVYIELCEHFGAV